MKRRAHPVLVAGAFLVTAGLLAWAALGFARGSAATAEAIAKYADGVDVTKLSGVERAGALRTLEQKVNGMSLEERRKWWLAGHWRRWFDNLTENEKGEYMEATLPTGLKQVLNAFENLPDATRKRAIDDALRQLKETHRLVMDHEPGHEESIYGKNPPPVLSPELENRARMIGFKTFFAESSAEAKAEMAPFVEELQHQLENARPPGT